MKKILVEISIPEGFEKRNIWVFAGMDPIQRFLQHKGFWEVKTDACVRCGKCCEAIGRDHPIEKFIGVGQNGCLALERQGREKLCGLGVFRPMRCSVGQNDFVKCKVKWASIK